jgi:hypothetical protein
MTFFSRSRCDAPAKNTHHCQGSCIGAVLRVPNAANPKHAGDKPRPRRGRWQRVAIRAGAFWLVCVNTLQRQLPRVDDAAARARACLFRLVLFRENSRRVRETTDAAAVPACTNARAGAENANQRWCYFGGIRGESVKPPMLLLCRHARTRAPVPRTPINAGAISGEFAASP